MHQPSTARWKNSCYVNYSVNKWYSTYMIKDSAVALYLVVWNFCSKPETLIKYLSSHPKSCQPNLSCNIQTQSKHEVRKSKYGTNKLLPTYQFMRSGTLRPKNCSTSVEQLLNAMSCNNLMSRSFNRTSRINSSWICNLNSIWIWDRIVRNTK